MTDLPPGFRWLPGMLTDDGHRVVRVVNGVAVRSGGVVAAVVGPDWTDPLTALGLLVLVREAYSDPNIHVRCNRAATEWTIDCVGTPEALLLICAPTETEALKAALAAAPRKG